MTRDEINAAVEVLEKLEEYTPDPNIDNKLTSDGIYDKHEINGIGVINLHFVKVEVDGKEVRTVKTFRLPGSLEKMKAMPVSEIPVVEKPARRSRR